MHGRLFSKPDAVLHGEASENCTSGEGLNSRDLLDSLIHPSKTVSDQYQTTAFLLEDGRSIIGRVVNLSGNTLLVSANMLDPGKLTSINRDEIEAMRPSKVSQMPDGLLNILAKNEILDLLAYLRSGGDPGHSAFR
ncbi:MAG: hypothetical protein IH991_24305 [Planctomycetes bacterium]|nr:hypothetical protein [Planctomycetota bacterium]